MLHVWWRKEMHAGFWWGNRRQRDYCEDIGKDGIIVLVAVRVMGWEVVKGLQLAQD
jgi:hypothetical protein